MAHFGNAFSALKAGKKISKEELIWMVRQMIAAEYEAVQMYMQVVDATDDELTKKVFTDISNEEKVHAGEFLRLLKHLAPDEESFYKEGEGEVEEMMKELGL